MSIIKRTNAMAATIAACYIKYATTCINFGKAISIRKLSKSGNPISNASRINSNLDETQIIKDLSNEFNDDARKSIEDVLREMHIDYNIGLTVDDVQGYFISMVYGDDLSEDEFHRYLIDKLSRQMEAISIKYKHLILRESLKIFNEITAKCKQKYTERKKELQQAKSESSSKPSDLKAAHNPTDNSRFNIQTASPCTYPPNSTGTSCSHCGSPLDSTGTCTGPGYPTHPIETFAAPTTHDPMYSIGAFATPFTHIDIVQTFAAPTNPKRHPKTLAAPINPTHSIEQYEIDQDDDNIFAAAESVNSTTSTEIIDSPNFKFSYFKELSKRDDSKMRDLIQDVLVNMSIIREGDGALEDGYINDVQHYFFNLSVKNCPDRELVAENYLIYTLLKEDMRNKGLQMFRDTDYFDNTDTRLIDRCKEIERNCIQKYSEYKGLSLPIPTSTQASSSQSNYYSKLFTRYPLLNKRVKKSSDFDVAHNPTDNSRFNIQIGSPSINSMHSIEANNLHGNGYSPNRADSQAEEGSEISWLSSNLSGADSESQESIDQSNVDSQAVEEPESEASPIPFLSGSPRESVPDAPSEEEPEASLEADAQETINHFLSNLNTKSDSSKTQRYNES